MINIKKISVDGDDIYLRKDFLGYRVVSPIKNEDGTYNWMNLILGNKRVILFTIVWLLIMAFIFLGVQDMLRSCKEFAKDPCKYIELDCSIERNRYGPDVPNYIRGGGLNEP